MRITLLSVALLVTALAAVSHAVGIEPLRQDDGEKEEETKRLEAWPELAKSERATVTKEIQRLRKARTPEMSSQAHEALVARGAAVAPLLLPKLGKEKDEEARRRMEAVLEKLTGPAHTRLLAAEFDDKSLAVRAFCMRRVAAFPDPGIREAAEKALERARASEKKKKGDPLDTYLSSLAAMSAGSLEGLDTLVAVARDDWKTRGPELHTACAGARGPEASERLAVHLAKGARADKLAALRLLAGCGDVGVGTRSIKPFLDEEDAGLRIAAINALRGIVDGDPPLVNLSVFDSIERAKKWKRKI